MFYTIFTIYATIIFLKKLTLFQIQLSKKIIPECLRLGDIFFTHMSVFGTINKEDGTMSIHFDERDIISCVFHLGSVIDGRVGGQSFLYTWLHCECCG